MSSMMTHLPSRTKITEVTTAKPWLLVLMVDESHSMQADWGGTKRRMSDIVEQAVNQLLYDMALNYNTSSGLDEDSVSDRIHLRLLVYSGDGDVYDPIPMSNGSSYMRATGDEGWVQNYSDVHPYPSSKGDVEVPRWLQLDPHGRTPMLAAFRIARRAVEQHIEEYPDSFPPVVLNISDGEPTDCGKPIDWELLLSECDSIRSLGAGENQPIVCNVHWDPEGRAPPSLYPSEPPQAGGIESGLWEASSTIPAHMAPLVPTAGVGDPEGRRFFVYNSNVIHFHEFLQFSTMLVQKSPNQNGEIRGGPRPAVLDVEFEEE